MLISSTGPFPDRLFQSLIITLGAPITTTTIWTLLPIRLCHKSFLLQEDSNSRWIRSNIGAIWQPVTRQRMCIGSETLTWLPMLQLRSVAGGIRRISSYWSRTRNWITNGTRSGRSEKQSTDREQCESDARARCHQGGFVDNTGVWVQENSRFLC